MCAQAAKKRGKGKKRAAAVDPLKCGVCEAVTEVVLSEVRKKENDTTTLDLRWGLTAEVKEGKARRLGKVIPYKRSELLAVEVESLKIPKILRLCQRGGGRGREREEEGGSGREMLCTPGRPPPAAACMHGYILSTPLYSPATPLYSNLLVGGPFLSFPALTLRPSTPLCSLGPLFVY